MSRMTLPRSSLYALAYLALIGLPQVGLFLLKPFLQQLFGADWWYAPFFIMLATAVVAPLLYTILQRRAQERFLQEQQKYRQTLMQAAQGMTLVRDLKKLLNLIVHVLTRTVKTDNASVWLLDKKMSRFVLQALRAHDGVKLGDTIPVDHPIVKRVLEERHSLVREKQPGVAQEMDRMEAAVIIPSLAEDRMIGFLALGQKTSGKPYSAEDLEVFEILANQAALAIENAQFYEELKHTQADIFQTAKMASLGHMAGGMSHQINNRFHVLTILAGTLKATLKDLDPAALEAQRLQELWMRTLETLSKIEENALRGGDIVKTILKFSRPSQEYRLTDTSQIIATTLEVASYRVNLSLIDVVQDVPSDLPQVKGDSNQLADSLCNLVTNAFDAIQKKAEMIQEKQIAPSSKDPTPFRGRIRFRASVEHGQQKSWVVLEVEDNGIGITREELENLFIPFFTTKATTEKGTGLGLYVIQRILQQHGGAISANSTYGVGTKFTLKLPAPF